MTYSIMVSSSHHDSFELKARKGLASWALATLENLTIDGRPAGGSFAKLGRGRTGICDRNLETSQFLVLRYISLYF